MIASYFFLAAALAVFATILVHVLIGGRLYVRPLLAADLPDPLKWMGYMTWHVGTAAFVLICAGFAAAAVSPAHTILALAATLLTGSFVLVAVGTSLRSGLPFQRFPVIPLFGVVTLLGAAGLILRP